MTTKFSKTFNYKSQIDPNLFPDAPKEFLKELEKYNQETKFLNLVSKFETENKNVYLDNVIVEFSMFLQNEGVEPWNLQPMRENYRQLLCRRIAEKVNKSNEMTNSEGYILKDYLCTLIHSTGRNYITVPVEKINEDTIQDVISEAVDKITSDEIKKGNVPDYFLTNAPEAQAILSDPFYSIIDAMKEEQGIE